MKSNNNIRSTSIAYFYLEDLKKEFLRQIAAQIEACGYYKINDPFKDNILGKEGLDKISRLADLEALVNIIQTKLSSLIRELTDVNENLDLDREREIYDAHILKKERIRDSQA